METDELVKHHYRREWLWIYNRIQRRSIGLITGEREITNVQCWFCLNFFLFINDYLLFWIFILLMFYLWLFKALIKFRIIFSYFLFKRFRKQCNSIRNIQWLSIWVSTCNVYLFYSLLSWLFSLLYLFISLNLNSCWMICPIFVIKRPIWVLSFWVKFLSWFVIKSSAEYLIKSIIIKFSFLWVLMALFWFLKRIWTCDWLFSCGWGLWLQWLNWCLNRVPFFFELLYTCLFVY